MVFIDSPRNGWCHMVSDSREELHLFAEKLGVKRCWFENKRGKNHPHYDIPARLHAKAIELGVVLVNSREIVRILKEGVYLPPVRS